MSLLRTLPTGRLLALLAAVAVIAAGGTAIALGAVGGGGPVPPAKPLASAVHDAVAAPEVNGITARITFTNKLIDSVEPGGRRPAPEGREGPALARRRRQAAARAPDRQRGRADRLRRHERVGLRLRLAHRLPRQAAAGEARGQGRREAADARRGPEAPRRARQDGRPVGRDAGQRRRPAGLHGADLAEARRRPARRRRAGVGRREGRAAARRRLRPGQQHAGARAQGRPHQLRQGARLGLRRLAAGGRQGRQRRRAERRARRCQARRREGGHGRRAGVEGAAVQALGSRDAGRPASARGPSRGLEGREGGRRHLRPGPRRRGRDRAAGRAHARRPAASAATAAALQLPKVSINGATGEELDTALATMIRFQRGGVAYTVLGSVPPAAAQAAARGL